MKAQLGLTPSQDEDDALIEGKVDAAENHIDRLLGYSMRTRWPAPADGAVTANVPPALVEAVMQLAAWWYENREAATDMNKLLPFGVTEIVNEYREWSF
ncbi:head-tail connector protein [Paracoccus sp. KR1-242]|uniref:head-tail connector protein n=1 Tax=Paracoccus sp. KR1-242 TaxID=3410028 RepID=UPI003C2D869F